MSRMIIMPFYLLQIRHHSLQSSTPLCKQAAFFKKLSEGISVDTWVVQ